MTRTDTYRCFCADHGCPYHPGEACRSIVKDPVWLRRVDMDDNGEAYCTGCAADALESGVFEEITR